MSTWLQIVLTIVTALITSSGLWAFLGNRFDRTNAEREVLIGLAHDRIMSLAMSYIERGYITQEEYENLYSYLYKPYTKLGGNGSAVRVMKEVDTLPIHKRPKEENHHENE